MRKTGFLRRLPIYIVLGMCAPFVITECIVWQAHSRFDERTSDAKLLGKTPDEIVLILGKPIDRIGYSDGSFDYVYEGEYRAVCHVDFRNGVVSKVERLSD
jgi:hypothetical protein